MIVLIALAALYLMVIGVGLMLWRWPDRTFPPYVLGGGILMVWTLVFVGKPDRPNIIPLIPWSSRGSFAIQPELLIDHVSWLFLLVVVSLLLVYVLIFPELNRKLVWVLGLSCASSLGILAGNILTLLFSWILVDVLQYGYHFRNHSPDLRHDQFVLSFAYRLLGPFLVVYAHFFSLDMGVPFTFQVIAPRIAGLLILACGVRYLFTLPKLSPADRAWSKPGQLALIHSMTGAVCMLIIIRSAASGVLPGWKSPSYGLAGCILLFCALWWVTSRDLTSGGNSWLAGWFMFITLAAVNGLEMVSISWALAALLSGNMLFLFAPADKFRYGNAALFIFGILAWPYTPLWRGAALFSQGLWGVLWALVFGLFLAGGMRHVMRWDEARSYQQTPVLALHMAGLVFLAFVHLFLAFQEGLAPASAQFWNQGWRFLLPVIVLIPFLLARNRISVLDAWIPDLKNALSSFPGAISDTILQVGRLFSSIVMGTFRILEGRGGLIWALLGVFFLLSLLASSGGG